MRRQVIAWLLSAVALGTFVAFGVVLLTPLTPAAVYQSGGGAGTAAFILPFTFLAAVGGLLAARRPENPVGWAALGAAASLSIGALCSVLCSVLVYDHISGAPWVGLGGVMWAAGASPAVVCLAIALLFFPDGRLPSHRWQWLLIFEACLLVLSVGLALADPSPDILGIGSGPDPSMNVSSPLAIKALGGFPDAFLNFAQFAQYPIELAAIVSVFLRLRGADSDRRHQIRWFATSAVVTIIASVAGSPAWTGSPGALLWLYIPLLVISGLAIPVALAVSILKYRLYDIDVIIGRALVYGALAVFITSVYVGIAVGVGTFVGSGGKPNLGLSILATAIVAVGFQPLRQRLQRIANRLVYGKRATPYEVLSAFSQHVAATYALDDVLPRMARLLGDGTGAQSATVWLRSGEELRPAATHPVENNGFAPVHVASGTLPAISGADGAVAVESHGELLGALTVVKRRGESLSPLEHKVIDDLAKQAGLVLKNVALTTELLQRMDDLRESRQRLVQAQDQERRRLERNLHDGAQQHLVALKVKIGLVKMLSQRDPDRARATLTQLRTDADEALDALRDLARGIYPPLLAEKGLAVALESQARKATVPVSVEADDIGRYAQDVEATVYFCVLEALQNIQKYAEASQAVVRLCAGGDRLTFEVQDDGRGFDVETVRRGAGLSNMRDRLDALGGSLQLRSELGHGSMVCGEIPVASLAAMTV